MSRFVRIFIPPSVLALGVAELGLIIASFVLATVLVLGPNSVSVLNRGPGMGKIVFMGVICFLCMCFADLYNPGVVTNEREAIGRLPQAFGFACIIGGILYYVFPSVGLGQGVFLLGVILLVVVLGFSRMGFIWLSQLHVLARNVLVIGDGQLAHSLVREVEARPEFGLRILGFVVPTPAEPRRTNQPIILGTTAELGSLVQRYRIEHVIVAMNDRRGRMPFKELMQLRAQGISIQEGIGMYESITGKIPVEVLRPSWLLFDSQLQNIRLVRFFQQVVSLAIAAVVLLVLAPLIFFIAVLIKLSSKGPVFYQQERVGHAGRTFVMFKFRTMRADAESLTGPVWSAENDPRITLIGRYLRKWRLDELPQLINVARGEMNIVGPRPERPVFVNQLREQIPFYDARHAIRPGITGWAQVNHKYANSISESMEKLQYDLFYVKHASVGLDLMVLLQTVKVVLAGRGAH